MEQSSSKEDLPALPVEVWQMVAARMSTQEWAKVSTTCRAMYQVQPRHISVLPSQIRDIRWVVKHWNEAITLSMNMSSATSLDIAQGGMALLMHSANQLPKLRIVSLSAPVFGEEVTCGSCLVDDTPIVESCAECRDLRSKQVDHWAPWLAMFLMHAGHIQTLFLRVTTFSVPLVSTLRHLVLRVREDIDMLGCESLQQLHVLQTLCIQWEGVEHEGHLGEYGHSSCRHAQPLDMSACTQLTAVRLTMLMPYSFAVPEKCRVTIGCDLHFFFGNCDWQNNFIRRTHQNRCAWHLHETGRGYYRHYNTDLLNILSCNTSIGNLTLLRLDLDRIRFIPMGLCLQNLKNLHIYSKTNNHLQIGPVVIQVCQGLRLESFVVVARDLQLRVPIGDLADFAGSIKMLYFKFEDYFFSPCSVVATLLTQYLAVRPRQRSVYEFSMTARFPRDAKFSHADICRCGACNGCLRAANIFGKV